MAKYPALATNSNRQGWALHFYNNYADEHFCNIYTFMDGYLDVPGSKPMGRYFCKSMSLI